MSEHRERSELRVVCPAASDQPAPMRHALAAFMTAVGITADTADDILTAVGEALANAVEHGHDPQSAAAGTIALSARLESGDTLAIEVRDDGTFVERPEARPFRGFGLRIIESIASETTVRSDGGTCVSMRFTLRTA